jgi:hypothetical protein
MISHFLNHTTACGKDTTLVENNYPLELAQDSFSSVWFILSPLFDFHIQVEFEH